MLAFAGLPALARKFGPIVVSAPDAYWLVLSPLDRRAVLRPVAVRLLVVSAVTGGALGVVALVVLGVPLLSALVLGASPAVASMAAAVWSQHHGDTWLTTGLTIVAITAGLTALAAHTGRLPAVTLPGGLPAVAVVVAGLTAVPVRSVWRSLACFPARAVRHPPAWCRTWATRERTTCPTCSATTCTPPAAAVRSCRYGCRARPRGRTGRAPTWHLTTRWAG